MHRASRTLATSAMMFGTIVAQAAVVEIDVASFVADPGQIRFSEYAIGTLNPTYTASQYGGAAGSPSVSFGSFFTGQTLGVVGTDCAAGTAPGGCVRGTPAGALSLDLSNGGGTFIATDTNHVASPVLSGSPFLNGSIAMLFSVDQSGVLFDGGFFNAIGTTRVTAYGRDGTVLGSIVNASTGIQVLALGTDDGAAIIAGLLVSLVAPEAAGYTIDGVRFGRLDVRDPGTVPEPSSLALFALASIGLAVASRRRLVST